MLVTKFEKCPLIISSNIFFYPPFLSFPSGTSLVCMLEYLILFHRSLRVGSFFLSVFTLFSSDLIFSRNLSSSLLSPLPFQICCFTFECMLNFIKYIFVSIEMTVMITPLTYYCDELYYLIF